MDPLTAINAAINRDWKQAVKINSFLLKQNPKDTDAANRLGRAMMELGHKTKAQQMFSRVLRLDKFNTIAAKNLDLLKSSRANRTQPTKSFAPPPLFLEEPGITKTVSLIRLGDPKILTSLHPGTPVNIVCRGHSVTAISPADLYLGRLPDDLSSRLRPFIHSGNQYSAWIKSVDSKSLKVFIKEMVRSSKFKNIPSFPITEKLTYAAFTPPELVHEEKPDVASTEEDTDSFTESPEAADDRQEIL